jgi:hypothetical protein
LDITSVLHKKLEALAKKDSIGQRAQPSFSIYVIEVEKIDPKLDCDFYVGSTALSVLDRFYQHIEGHNLASKPFKYGKGKARRIRWDLMEEFPKFYTRDSVEIAEGLVAKALQSGGWSVHCNKL